MCHELHAIFTFEPHDRERAVTCPFEGQSEVQILNLSDSVNFAFRTRYTANCSVYILIEPSSFSARANAYRTPTFNSSAILHGRICPRPINGIDLGSRPSIKTCSNARVLFLILLFHAFGLLDLCTYSGVLPYSLHCIGSL